MAANPVFVGTPRFVNLIVNNTNAGDNNYISPTTVATVLTVGSTGARIDTVYMRHVGTNAGTALRFFVDTVGTGGTNNRLVHEESLGAATAVSTSSLVPNVWRAGLVLPPNAVLRATIGNTAVTNGIAVSVEYGEF